MRISFAFKIGSMVGFSAVGITAAAVLYYYAQTKELVIDLMSARLLDIGKASDQLFSKKANRAMARLKQTINRNTQPYHERLAGLEEGSPAASLPEAVAEKIMAGDDFQYLAQVLRRIRYSSRSTLAPEGDLKPILRNEPDQPVIKFAYIHFAIPEAPDYSIVRWLADADYDTPDEEVAVGSLYRVPQQAVKDAFSGKLATENKFVPDEWGPSLTAAFPILDETGAVLAVVGLDMNVSNEANRINQLWLICLSIIGLAVLIAILLTLILTRMLVRPVLALRAGAERVKARDFSGQIVVKNRDELGLLAETFNSMVAEIRDYAEDLERLNKAYYRFVPREFLEFLGRAAITEIKLGDQTLQEMTILFSDIRSFTSLSENMTPKENFNFLNDYLKKIGPVIRGANGFIDKYIGDAVMALFPSSPVDAIKAAIKMRVELAKFNQRRLKSGLPRIEIGIGIHSGMLMLGTIGEEERMESTVISDSVNLASRLEGLTKEFGSPLIISEYTYHKLGDELANLAIRPLGRVYVKGKKESVKIYEVIDRESDDQANEKLSTLEAFSQMVGLFARGKYGDADRVLEEIEKINPRDPAVQIYRRMLSSKGKQN